MFGQIDKPGVREAYEATCREHGHEPGMCMLPPLDSVTTAFVAEDVDRAWEEVGPSILHDVKMYGAWNPQTGTAASISHAQTVDELRAEQGPHRIYSVDEAIALGEGRGDDPAHAAVRRAPARHRLALPPRRHRPGDARPRLSEGSQATPRASRSSGR